MGLLMGALLSASVIGVPLGSFLAYGTTWRTPFWVMGVLAGRMTNAGLDTVRKHIRTILSPKKRCTVMHDRFLYCVVLTSDNRWNTSWSRHGSKIFPC